MCTSSRIMVLQKVKLFDFFIHKLQPEKENCVLKWKIKEKTQNSLKNIIFNTLMWRLQHFHGAALTTHLLKRHNFMFNLEELIFQRKLCTAEEDINAELDMATSEIKQPPGTSPGPWSFTFCHYLISLQEQVHYLLVLRLLHLQSLFAQVKKIKTQNFSICVCNSILSLFTRDKDKMIVAYQIKQDLRNSELLVRYIYFSSLRYIWLCPFE